jgi:hypothetical protein
MPQTAVNDHNRQDFFKKIYPHLKKSKQQLIQLDEFSSSSYVLINCCGWHYKNLWPELNIIGLETLTAAKDFLFDRSMFQGLIDDRDFYKIIWPKVKTNNSVLVFDYSPLLKYRTIDGIVNIVSSAALLYQSTTVVLQLSTVFVDDTRMTDRITNFLNLIIPNYTITTFEYHTQNLKIVYKKNYLYD